MAPSPPDSPTTSSQEVIENNLQPFFVLHRGICKKSDKNPNRTVKTRRRIDLSPSLPKIGENPELEKPGEGDDQQCDIRRLEAFEAIWSKIESTIKDVLRNLNTTIFNEIHQWVCESFKTISSVGAPLFTEATHDFPVIKDATSKKLFTGLVLTKNMEFVDDLLTFQELGLHLKSQGCHVANLSSLDFSVKNGIGGCLRSLLRQLLMVTLDAPDISILATWYREQGKFSSPIVIIIDDLERCCGTVMSDFIFMLSEWVLKIPVILIMGVATTLDALRNVLPSNTLHHLCPCKFILGTPSERMDAIVEAVLVKHCSGFSVSHKVAVFMRNYFVSQDGTITSFIRALKIACAQHFSMGPLSFVLLPFLHEKDSQVVDGKKYGLSQDMMLEQAFQLPSFTRLSEMKKLQLQWSSVVMCLYEAGKCDKIQLLDLFCEALDPESDKLRVSQRNQDTFKKHYNTRNGGIVCRAIRNVKDLSAVKLYKLLKDWEKHLVDIPEIHDKVKELLSLLNFEDDRSLKQDLNDISKRRPSRSHLNFEKDSKAVNEKAARLAEYMVRNFLQPIECIAFHEIVCFKNVDKLQSALIGDPRRRIQLDLLEFHSIMQCSCCCMSGSTLLPSMHDSSIMYTLAQEHGDLINVHDWYQSFKSLILCSSNKGKRRTKHSPAPKKRKFSTEPAKPSEALIQARFCRAVMELQFTGLLRMPGKRRTDYVQRVAFGL
ncbi:origin of replication complex subunit 3 isoform X2 [Euphorbia lathyris]|uniref:origin of replication complex subunit 3 isoform X2 n=1 Tax=Euphorbia lathyris TaxID=212925 RepID=UPI0033133BA9